MRDKYRNEYVQLHIHIFDVKCLTVLLINHFLSLISPIPYIYCGDVNLSVISIYVIFFIFDLILNN